MYKNSCVQNLATSLKIIASYQIPCMVYNLWGCETDHEQWSTRTVVRFQQAKKGKGFMIELWE